MRDGQPPRIIWDKSSISDVPADVFKVAASREEVAFCFGALQLPGKQEIVARLKRRILVSPVTAKRLLLALNQTVTAHELKFGYPDGGAGMGAAQSDISQLLSLPSFNSDLASRLVGKLYEQLQPLNLLVGLERSFKISENKLSSNRFLLAFEPKIEGRDPFEAISGIFIGLGMPQKLLQDFSKGFPEATMVGFGIEEEDTSCVIKSYLEFRGRYEDAKKNISSTDSYLSHLGFKWDPENALKCARADYYCYPGFGVSEVLGRLEGLFYRKPNDKAFEIIQNILNLAARKVGPDKVLYLEVSEQGNSRSSFDINLYGANFRLQELHSNILAMGRHYLIPDDEFSRFFDSIKRCTLGHIAGGMDRKGRDFLTVYFGE